MFCPNCGIEVPDDMAFCPECGTKIASGLGSSQKNKESKQSTPPTSNSKKKEKNNKEGNPSGIIVKAAIGLVSIGAIALLVLALTGQFDKDAEKLGEAPVLKGNDTVSAFKDTRSSEVSVSTDLMDYVDKSEDEIIDIFGFEKNESHAYPGDRSTSDEKLDYCFMFMCEDGKVKEVSVYDKTFSDYPNANIYGVYYNMDESAADQQLKSKGLTRISEYEDSDGGLRVAYYDSSYRTTAVVYTNGKVSFVGYSTEDQSDLIKELEAENSTADVPETLDNSSNIDYDELKDTIMIYYAMYYGTNNVAAEVDHEDENSITIWLYDPYATTTSSTLGFYEYNKKTGVWTDSVTGELVDFDAAADAHNEWVQGHGSYPEENYILPNSSDVELTEADLRYLSAKELTYARNEIYARHGYIFKSSELNEYFGSMSWYVPNPNFDGTLHGIEQSNANFIKDYQEQFGLQYKPN